MIKTTEGGSSSESSNYANYAKVENLPRPILHFELVRPLPQKFPSEPHGIMSALRVIVGNGGTVRRRDLLDCWRAGDAVFGSVVAEKYVEALVDQGYLTLVFTTDFTDSTDKEAA